MSALLTSIQGMPSCWSMDDALITQIVDRKALLECYQQSTMTSAMPTGVQAQAQSKLKKLGRLTGHVDRSLSEGFFQVVNFCQEKESLGTLFQAPCIPDPEPW